MHAHPVEGPTELLRVAIESEHLDADPAVSEAFENLFDWIKFNWSRRNEHDAFGSDVEPTILGLAEMVSESFVDIASEELRSVEHGSNCDAVLLAGREAMRSSIGMTHDVLFFHALEFATEVRDSSELGHNLARNGAEQLLARPHRSQVRRPVGRYVFDQLLDPAQHLRSPLV